MRISSGTGRSGTGTRSKTRTRRDSITPRCSRCEISHKEDFRDLYVSRYYFGCEADDPINAWAFNRKANPMGARLNAFFSSDIGHFDVPDMTEVVPEAYELVEHGLLDDDDF